MMYTGRKNLLFIAAIFALSSLGVVVAASSPAFAVDCGGVQTSVVSCGNTNDTTGSPVVSILVVVIQILTAAIGAVAIGALVYAGILYSSASGDSSRINKAKEIIRNTLIGLAAFALMGLALNYLIPGGLFTGTATFGAGGNGQGNITAKNIIINEPKKEDEGGVSVTNGACYWNHTAGYPGGSEFHINNKKNATKTNSYAFENSPEGIRYAKSHGYKRIDIDIQTTKDGVVVASHSTNPFMTKGNGTWGGFYDPAGKIKHGLIQDLTWAQVSQLRHKVGGYKIHKIEDIIATIKETGLSVIFEFKTPKTLIKKIPAITAMINQAHIKANFLGITSKSGQKAALEEARKHGFWARYLWAKTNGKPIKTSTCG